MRNNGFLIKRKGSDWNMPTQKSTELKLFEVKESTAQNQMALYKSIRRLKLLERGSSILLINFLEKKNNHTIELLEIVP